MLFPTTLMKYLPQDVAFGKMRAIVEAAKILRKEFAGRA
jgi:methionine synthase II (cobalamin-independent)